MAQLQKNSEPIGWLVKLEAENVKVYNIGSMHNVQNQILVFIEITQKMHGCGELFMPFLNLLSEYFSDVWI